MDTIKVGTKTESMSRFLGDLRLSASYPKPIIQTLSSFLCAAFEDNTHNDVTLTVNGDQLIAHRLVLSCNSPVFEAMFSHSCTESLSGHVDLTESFSSIERLRQFLSFLYGKPLELDSENVIEMLDVSSRYFVGNLTELCVQHLFKHLCPSNCLTTWLIASLYGLEDLEFVCRHLFSEVLPLVGIQNSVVTFLPSWFIVSVLMKSKLPELFPILFPTLIIVWLLGNFIQRESTVKKYFVVLKVSEQTILTIFNNLDLNQTERALVKSVFARAFVFTADSKNKPSGLFYHSLSNMTNHQKTVSNNNQHRMIRQYLCVLLLNETNNTAAFYCKEHKKWRTLQLPTYDGTTLGIVSGNLLVRIVAKGSSANLFNLRTGETTHTSCVLATVAEYDMEVAFLPVQSNYFLSDGHLHIALIVRRFRSFKLVVFRFDHISKRWFFLMGFPLLRNLNHVDLRVYSTRHNLVYLIVTVRPILSSIRVLNVEFSHVFVVDLLRFEMVGSSCGYFGNSVLNNDGFILMDKLHFVTNRPTLLGHRDKSPSSARVLVIDPYDQKYMHVLYPVRTPKLERLPIIPSSRKDVIGSESLSAVKESMLCLLHHMGPYISNMFIFDMECRKWSQAPSPPPMFKRKPSKPMLIYSYAPVSTLLPETEPNVISKDKNFFQEWQLGRIHRILK